MPMKTFRALPCALLGLAALACNSPTGTDSRELRVVAAANAVTMENPNDWPVFYLLANPQFLAVADLVLCENPNSSCERVPARGSSHVAYTSIVGFQAGEREATLWQWRLERQVDGTYRSTNFHATTVVLH